MAYNFLILSFIFLIPGIIIYITRNDLRNVIHVMAFCAIPFAFTERFFYPSYWEPVFLFDLADKIGFGIEDIIFVIGLSAFTSTAYAFFFGLGYSTINKININSVLFRGATVLGLAFSLIVFVALLNIEMIYGSFAIMLCISCFLVMIRKDLAIPGFMGGILSVILYSTLCLCLQVPFPGIFKLTWHTDQFLNIFILGIPLEEIMYGFSSGVIATVFYPYVFCKRFDSRLEI
jgi:lycopene cyclase-like protein